MRGFGSQPIVFATFDWPAVAIIPDNGMNFYIFACLLISFVSPSDSFLGRSAIHIIRSPRLFVLSTVEDVRKKYGEIEKTMNEVLPLLHVEKIRHIVANYELEVSQPGFWEQADNARKIMHELETKKELISTVNGWASGLEDAQVGLEMFGESGCETSDENREMLIEAESILDRLSKELGKWKLDAVLTGPYDSRSCRLTIRSGAGGVDAQDWAQMLLKMYELWAHRRGFSCKLVDISNDGVGIRSAELEIEGDNVFGYLSKEKGTHRLVRTSPFNSEGKRMTSFAAVETMPILLEEETELSVEIPQKDIQLSFMRCGGAGGQVNTHIAHFVVSNLSQLTCPC